MSLVFSTGSKFIRTSATALWGSSVSVASTRRFSEAFGEREKGYENVDVRKHDEELLKRLRDSEAARDKAEARAKAAEEAITETPSKSAKSAAKTASFSSNQEFVTMEEFLELRKELIDRIRNLEDDLHEIKYDKYKKK